MSEVLKCRLRCAVYTRKSTDEGLDQEYNSIDAQRDAGEAYIASQRAEGWIWYLSWGPKCDGFSRSAPNVSLSQICSESGTRVATVKAIRKMIRRRVSSAPEETNQIRKWLPPSIIPERREARTTTWS
jgi:hypothetical protein